MNVFASLVSVGCVVVGGGGGGGGAFNRIDLGKFRRRIANDKGPGRAHWKLTTAIPIR